MVLHISCNFPKRFQLVVFFYQMNKLWEDTSDSVFLILFSLFDDVHLAILYVACQPPSPHPTPPSTKLLILDKSKLTDPD